MRKNNIKKEHDRDLLAKCIKAAVKVDFLDKNDYIPYVTSLYNAMIWGKKIDLENKEKKRYIR